MTKFKPLSHRVVQYSFNGKKEKGILIGRYGSSYIVEFKGGRRHVSPFMIGMKS